jgi:UDP-N-acetylmuramoyl-tripeptide--D-alanyl-D-alanine ligase
MIEKKEILKLKSVKQQFVKQLLEIFTAVCIDSRHVKSTEIFFAIIGENNDGHKYLKDVFSKSATIAIVNKKWFDEEGHNFSNYNLIVVEDTTLALGELANIHRKHINPKIIAVGGSNGKTTTKEMLYAVLSKKYITHKTEGNFNNHIGVPLTLLKLKKEHEWCILEVGCNHFNEIDYLCRIAEPNCGIITNIGKEHLEFFKNKAGVAKAEFELFDYLAKKKNTICFVNLDDIYISKYAKTLADSGKFSYSYKNAEPDVIGKFIGYDNKFHPSIELSYKKKNHQLKIATFGKHSIYNGLAVASVGLKLNVDIKDIQEALANFKPEAGKRMDLKDINGIIVINDTYNSNPDSVKLGLETLRDYNAKGNKYIVLGDMLELGKVSEEEHLKIGKLIKKYKLDNLYSFGKDSFFISSAAKGIKFNKHYSDKNELIKHLKSVLKKNDIVYIKGSRGMKMEEVAIAINI